MALPAVAALKSSTKTAEKTQDSSYSSKLFCNNQDFEPSAHHQVLEVWKSVEHLQPDNELRARNPDHCKTTY